MPNSAFTPSVLTISSGSSGSGAGEISAITNGSAATDTTGWTSATRSLSSSPLSPVTTTCFSVSTTAGAESSTSGGYATFTMPTGLQNRKLKVEFFFNTPATDSYRVSVYRSGVRVPLTTDSGGFSALPAGVTGGKYVGYFDTDGTTSWTVNVTRVTGATGPCQFTNVIVGPGIQPQGAAVGEWQSYTPTVSTGTWTNTRGFYRRVGDTAHIKIYAGPLTANGSGVFSWTLPTGLTADYNKLGANGVTPSFVDATDQPGTFIYVGTALVNNQGAVWYMDGTSPSSNADLRVSMATTTTISVVAGSAVSNNRSDVLGSANGLAGVNGVIQIEATVPISEWAGSGTVNLAQNDVEFAYNTSGITAQNTSDTTSFGYGPVGALINSINSASVTPNQFTTMRVRFQNSIQQGDDIQVQYQTGSGLGWIPAEAWTPNVNGTGSNSCGVSWSIVNSTDVDVRYGNGGINSPGATWANYATYRWRVRKSSAGAAVGFGIVVPGTSSGLVSASGLTGNTTGNAIASGFVGEFIYDTSTTKYTTSDVNIITRTLTAGTWEISASTGIQNSAGVTGVFLYISLNTAGTGGDGLGAGNAYTGVGQVGGGGGYGGTFSKRIIFLNGSQIIYIRGAVSGANVDNTQRTDVYYRRIS